ncbi:hypothetical protein C0585_01395 [Candidatus Woesearchaeota archaeon]|nr:MAG: hypothetical protein C0585_01395 [Candidatus Woesearchaeota archaeon]
MTNKNKYIISGIIISIIIPILITIYSTLYCTNDFGCFFYILFPLFLGIIIAGITGLTGILFISISLIINLIFYSILGGFIGWLIYHFRNGKKSEIKPKDDSKTEKKKK